MRKTSIFSVESEKFQVSPIGDDLVTTNSYSTHEFPKYKIVLSLNNREINLLKASWGKMFTRGDLTLFCEQLYSNLLSLDPTLLHQFPSIHHQAQAFSSVLTMTISQLENLEVLDNYLMKLGKRHSRILNIEPFQFELLGESLVNTFYERFGRSFTQELEVLWIKLYMYLSNKMVQYGFDPITKNTGIMDEARSVYSIVSSEFSTRDDLSTFTERTAKIEKLGKFEKHDKFEPVLKYSIKEKKKSRMKIIPKKKDCVIM